MTHSFLKTMGAKVDPNGVITDFGSWRREAEAAQSGIALFDRSSRSRIAVRGSEIAPFLNRLLSFAVTEITIGQGCRPFMLDARGRIILAFTYVRVDEAEVYLDAPADHGDAVMSRIDMFHFGEDFTMEDVSKSSAGMTLAGPRAAACLADLGLPTPDSSWSHGIGSVADRPVRVIRSAYLRRPCFDVWCDPMDADRIYSVLTESGATLAGERALEFARITDGVPVYPSEFGEHCTPLDAAGSDGLTDGKGCYPGQEVIERTLAIGRPARMLLPVLSEAALTPGDTLAVAGKDVGTITSSAEDPEGGWIGLALVKSRAASADQFVSGESVVRRRDVEE